MRFISLIAAALYLQFMLPAAVKIEQYHSHDFVFHGADAPNSFDVELAGEFTGPDNTRLSVPGFYDGEGVWKRSRVRATAILNTQSQ